MPLDLGSWFLACRPKTLSASIAPVTLGIAISYEQGISDWGISFIILVTAILIQIGTNFANDVFDYERGADTEKRLGPSRMVQQGLITPSKMKSATVAILGLALLLGCYLVSQGGVPILIIGATALVLAVAYTAGPYSLAYTGVADIFVILYFGPIATAGTAYLITGELNPRAIIYGFSVGLLSTAILAVNNARDLESDRAVGKKTLAVRFGPEFIRWEYTLLLIVAGSLPILDYILLKRDPLVLLPSLIFIPIVFLLRDFGQAKGLTFNRVLESTAKLVLLFAALYLLGLFFRTY
jgi:1,4-dihydroxy-2-naphthoate octaprenyltransferase